MRNNYHRRLAMKDKCVKIKGEWGVVFVVSEKHRDIMAWHCMVLVQMRLCETTVLAHGYGTNIYHKLLKRDI